MPTDASHADGPHGDRAPVVTLDHVSRTITTRGTATVLLAPTSLVLREGTLVVLAGPSGSGKTTLCNIVTGWERTDTGSITWADADVQTWAELSVAPQRLALLPALDIRENLILPFWAAGRDVPEGELAELVAHLEIDALLDRRPSEVSFGEQQRTAIARAVLGNPRLAVLDEPTGHQDEPRASLVIDALLAARSRGTCVLVATHDPDVIAGADDVVALRSPLVATGTPSDVPD
jgi:ABC-type lipoprotein export system ATPase subunit